MKIKKVLVLIIPIILMVLFLTNVENMMATPEVKLRENMVNKDKTISKKNSDSRFVVIGDDLSSVKTYQEHIRESLNMNYISLGIEGATITKDISKISKDFSFGDVDFIIIQGGMNDFFSNIPLGREPELTRKNPNRDNFFGAYSGLVKDLMKNNNGVSLYIITPTQIKGERLNEIGHSLKDYVNAIRKIGDYHDVQVIDVFENISITKEAIDEYTVDGIHLNDKGYKIFADKFIEEFNRSN